MPVTLTTYSRPSLGFDLANGENLIEKFVVIAVDTTGDTITPSELGMSSFAFGQVQRLTGVTAGSGTAALGTFASTGLTVGNETATYHMLVLGTAADKLS